MKNYVVERFEKSVYMGFLLDNNANEYLDKSINLCFKMIEKYIENYNLAISKRGYPINLNFSEYDMSLEIRTIGTYVRLKPEDLIEVIKRIENRIYRNLKHALKSYTSEGIEIFDLDLLIEIQREGINTMGDTFLAFNNRKYTASFCHLYSII